MSPPTPSPRLFGTSGIRGNLERINTKLALDLGRALGTTLRGEGLVGVGTDARTSRQVLFKSFMAGLSSTGVDTADLGLVPMPAAASYSSLDSVASSVMITASHNPPTDNGFKFFRNGREFVRKEEVAIEDAVANQKFTVAQWTGVGSMHHEDIRGQYLARLKSFLYTRGGKGDGMRLLVDLANGAATDYTPRLLQDMGFSVSTVNSHMDGHFPGRPPEPSPTNLAETMRMAKALGVGVALCHDGDGDRLAVIDEEGRFVDQNRVIALFARDELERAGGGSVVVSIDTSSVIDEIVRSSGGRLVRVPLGSLQQQLFEDKNHMIVFASEPWKPIFTASGWWMDGILGSARFAQLTSERGKGRCTRLMKDIPEYPMLREQILCADELKAGFMSNVKGLLKSELTHIEQVLEVDGIRIDRSDGSYVLIRVSGTEPKARVYIGAKSQQALDTLSALSKDIMQRALEQAKKDRK